MLADLLGLNPTNDMQANISYAAKLYSLEKGGERIGNALLGKSRKEKLEEELLQRQIDALSRSPDTLTLNKAMLAGRNAPGVTGFLQGLLKTKPRTQNLLGPLADVIPISRYQFKSSLLKSAL